MKRTLIASLVGLFISSSYATSPVGAYSDLASVYMDTAETAMRVGQLGFSPGKQQLNEGKIAGNPNVFKVSPNNNENEIINKVDKYYKNEGWHDTFIPLSTGLKDVTEVTKLLFDTKSLFGDVDNVRKFIKGEGNIKSVSDITLTLNSIHKDVSNQKIKGIFATEDLNSLMAMVSYAKKIKIALDENKLPVKEFNTLYKISYHLTKNENNLTKYLDKVKINLMNKSYDRALDDIELFDTIIKSDIYRKVAIKRAELLNYDVSGDDKIKLLEQDNYLKDIYQNTRYIDKNGDINYKVLNKKIYAPDYASCSFTLICDYKLNTNSWISTVIGEPAVWNHIGQNGIESQLENSYSNISYKLLSDEKLEIKLKPKEDKYSLSSIPEEILIKPILVINDTKIDNPKDISNTNTPVDKIQIVKKAEKLIDEDLKRKNLETKKKLIAEHQAKLKAKKKAREEAEAKRKAEEQAGRDEEIRRKNLETKKRLIAEHKAKLEAEKKAKEEAEAKRKAEEQARKDEEIRRKNLETKKRLIAEHKAKLEAEKKAKEEAELKRKAEEQARRDEEIRRKNLETKKRLIAEHKAKLEAEKKAKEKAEAKRRAEEQAQKEAEAKRKAEELAKLKKDYNGFVTASVDLEKREKEREQIQKDQFYFYDYYGDRYLYLEDQIGIDLHTPKERNYILSLQDPYATSNNIEIGDKNHFEDYKYIAMGRWYSPNNYIKRTIDDEYIKPSLSEKGTWLLGQKLENLPTTGSISYLGEVIGESNVSYNKNYYKNIHGEIGLKINFDSNKVAGRMILKHSEDSYLSSFAFSNADLSDGRFFTNLFSDHHSDSSYIEGRLFGDKQHEIGGAWNSYLNNTDFSGVFRVKQELTNTNNKIIPINSSEKVDLWKGLITTFSIDNALNSNTAPLGHISPIVNGNVKIFDQTTEMYNDVDFDYGDYESVAWSSWQLPLSENKQSMLFKQAIYGRETLDMPNIGKARYQGELKGYLRTKKNSSIINQSLTGSVDISTNFDEHKVLTKLNIKADGENWQKLFFDNGKIWNDASFRASISEKNISSSVKGIFYGEKAKEIGGIFNINRKSKNSEQYASGIYRAKYTDVKPSDATWEGYVARFNHNWGDIYSIKDKEPIRFDNKFEILDSVRNKLEDVKVDYGNYDYVAWGEWGENYSYYDAYHNHVVYGEKTVDMPKMGTATYLGELKGDMHTASGVTGGYVHINSVSGEVKMNVDFSTKKGSLDMDMKFKGNDWSKEHFDITLNNSEFSSKTYRNTVQGGFFGSNANEAAGVFNIYKGWAGIFEVGYKANGVFRAKKQ